MSLSFSSLISGIRAAFTVLAVSAHNTANINTDGFKKQRANLVKSDHEGVEVKVQGGTGTLTRHQDNKDMNGNVASTVEIAEEMGVQIGAKNLLLANRAALKTANEIEKGLINIIG